MADLADVAYWVEHHRTTGDLVSNVVAHKIAEYWQIEPTLDDIAAAISYARTAGFETLPELYALKAWALET